jgi:hypothetical protein
MPGHFGLQSQNDALKLVDQFGELGMYVALDDIGFELLFGREEVDKSLGPA